MASVRYGHLQVDLLAKIVLLQVRQQQSGPSPAGVGVRRVTTTNTPASPAVKCSPPSVLTSGGQPTGSGHRSREESQAYPSSPSR
jgi:hypothetical protein